MTEFSPDRHFRQCQTRLEPQNLQVATADDLVVKVGSTPLKTTDLFVNLNPPYNQVSGENSPLDHKAPENIKEALKYKQTSDVLNHEIYTKNIGDPRWRE